MSRCYLSCWLIWLDSRGNGRVVGGIAVGYGGGGINGGREPNHDAIAKCPAESCCASAPGAGQLEN